VKNYFILIIVLIKNIDNINIIIKIYNFQILVLNIN